MQPYWNSFMSVHWPTERASDPHFSNIMCSYSTIVSYLVLKYWSICTSIWGLAGVMFLFCCRIVQIAQNSTKMYSYYNNCSIVHIVQIQIVGVNLEARMGQIMGIHGLLLGWLLDSVTGTWVPFIRWFQNSSFPLFRIVFIFSFSRVESVDSAWNLFSRLWSVESSAWNTQFEDRFYQLLILIPHLSILILFLGTFWRNLFWTVESNLSKPENHNFVDMYHPSDSFIEVHSCKDLKFGNSLVNFEFSVPVCCVKDELYTCDNFFFGSFF